MSPQTTASARLDVENVGGITETTVNVPPGVTVLAGQNATNRTSFLQAIMAAMGSDRVTLKGSAEEGRVSFEFRGETYERTLTRADGSLRVTGEGYLEDPGVAELFAFLLETNEARRAVALDGDLRDIIMRPVDVDAIVADIEELEARKGEVQDELATIENRKRDLPDLERRRRGLREQVDEKRERLAEVESEIDEQSRDVEARRSERSDVEDALDELQETRSDLEEVRRRVEDENESIGSLQRERRELEAELEDLRDEPVADTDELEDELDRLRRRRQTLNGEISELQSLVEYNEQRLEDGGDELLGAEEAGDGDVTDQLVGDETVVCWTCGSSVERSQIEATVERLRDQQSETVAELNDVESTLGERKEQKRAAEEQRDRRSELEADVEGLEDELDRRRERIESLKDRRERLTADVEALEVTVEDSETGDFDEVLALHREANQLEFEIERLESDLEDVEAEIASIESQVERADALREEREELLAELTDRRTKIEQIESAAVEQFNDHMDAILDVLGYENIDRIWIERVERTVRDGREQSERVDFDLHVVRSTEGGTAYEDSVRHLSESEREVTGLIFALAGYLVHDLHESVPFMLLDSLEAIDADRIADLVDYFADYADYLVVALLHEDAAALADEHTRITDI
ncbi:chromosome segregation protein SMC [Halobacterium sp. DL1]|jgi:DNA repair exonuclease SbcCD ATPase subunit|nr:chromosome segregation protein SMC [Halobacterium sp. DL1]